MFEKLDSIEDAPFDFTVVGRSVYEINFRIPSEWRMLYL